MDSRTTRWWDWLIALLLLALILTSTGRLGITRWTPELEIVQRLAVLAAVLGMALGVSSYERRATILLTIGYSLTLFPLQLAQALKEDVPDALERATSLGGRMWFSLSEFASGRPVEDWLFFVALLGAIYWIVALCAGYWLTRHGNFLAAVLPAGLILLIIQTYDEIPASRVWFAGFYIFLCLMLLARLNYIRERRQRLARRVFVNPESSADFTNGALLAAALLVLAAWSLPSALERVPALSEGWDRASEPWTRLRDRLSDAFASVEGGGTGVEFYGDELALGTGNQLSDAQIFEVTIQSSSRDVPRYYWRGRVYTNYEDGQWSTDATARTQFDPEEGNLPIPDAQGQRIANFVIESQSGQFTFYLPTQPVWVSRKGEVLSYRVPGNTYDMVWMRADTLLQGGETFQVRAVIVNPTVRELRAAGTEYPEWVTERYLQLPDDFSPRLRALAEQITRGQPTPYDQTAAVTSYLRDNIESREVIPAPPEDQDPLEWFVFTQKQGFCNYYASTEVVLLRSLGIPARLAVGYAEGESDDFERRFTVREKDAHAWPEVYFPGIGWVEFEPTGGQEALQRPAGVSAEGSGDNDAPLPEGDLDGAQNGAVGRPEQEDTPIDFTVDPLEAWRPFLRIGGWVAGLLLIAAFVLIDRRKHLLARAPSLLIAGFERRNLAVPDWLVGWQHYLAAGSIARSYASINIGLRLLGERPPLHATPAQRAAVLAELLPGAADSIATLAAEHQAELYSPRHGEAARARQSALALWRALIPAAARHAWKALLDRLIPG